MDSYHIWLGDVIEKLRQKDLSEMRISQLLQEHAEELYVRGCSAQSAVDCMVDPQED